MTKFHRGVLLAATAGICWGSMAVAGQYLLEEFSFRSSDLVCARLFGTGVLLLLYELLFHGTPWRGIQAKDAVGLTLYGFLLILIQYSFFEAIRLTNAGTAAVIVAIGPAIVLLYMHFFEGRVLTFVETMCVVLAFFGVVLLGSKGDFSGLEFSVAGVLWGIVSVCGGSTATLFVRHLSARHGAIRTVAWSMFAGGLMSFLCFDFLSPELVWTKESVFWYAYVVIFGTAIAFVTFVMSLRYLAATTATLVGCTEPVSGFVLAALVLGVQFTVYEVIGAIIVLSAIVLLSVKR